MLTIKLTLKVTDTTGQKKKAANKLQNLRYLRNNTARDETNVTIGERNSICLSHVYIVHHTIHRYFEKNKNYKNILKQGKSMPMLQIKLICKNIWNLLFKPIWIQIDFVIFFIYLMTTS